MEELNRLKEKVRPFIRDYLHSKGVVVPDRGHFRCIHPDHEDRDPSMVLYEESYQTFCFGCSTTADIFVAHHYLDGAPLKGTGFITRNLYPLLDKFGIAHEKVQFSEEVVRRDTLDNVYEKASLMLTEKERGKLKFCDNSAAEDRGWRRETCSLLGIGTVEDYEEFLVVLSRRTGLSKSYLKDSGITPRLFGPEYITFTIKNESGTPVGFVARTIGYKENAGMTKYWNTEERQNPKYIKSNILYGLHIARRYKEQQLHVLEGYPDLVTAQQNGVKCSCALGGTALTEGHVQTIKSLGFSSVNLVLDQDATGRAKMNQYIEKFGGTPGLSVTITHLPLKPEERADKNTNDVDYFIKTYGVRAYQQLEPVSIFEYQIEKNKKLLKSGKVNKIDFTEKMTKLILNEESRIKRGKMITKLSSITNVNEEDIRGEIERIENVEVDSITSRLSWDLKRARNADDIQRVLDEGQTSLLETSSTKEERQKLTVLECLNNFDKVVDDIRNRSIGIHGWVSGIDPIDNYIDGIPIPVAGGPLIGFGASAHHGKSALLLSIASGIVRNPKNNISLLYWAIDDSRYSVYSRLVATMTGVSLKVVQKIYPATPEQERKIDSAVKEIRGYIQSGRFQIKDDEVSRSKRSAERWIERAQKEFERPVLLIVDSFHNVSVGRDADADVTAKTKAASEWLKSSTKAQNFTALCSMEFNKQRDYDNLSLTHITGSSKTEFDFDCLATIINPIVATNGRSMDYFWKKNGKVMPVITVNFLKNKISGQRGPVRLLLDEDTTAVFAENPKEGQRIYSNTEGAVPESDIEDMLTGL